MNPTDPTDRSLRRRLIEGLASICGPADRGMAPRGENLFSYCSYERERLAPLSLEKPVLGIVVSGSKEVWRGETGRSFGTGTVFALPKGLELDFYNIPDTQSGLYQSLILEIDGRPFAGGPTPRRQHGAPPFGAIPLGEALVETLIHAARAIVAGAGSQAVRTARRDELLGLLRAEPAAAPLFAQSVAEQVAALVAATPGRDWTADLIARRIGVSVATLRRRLGDEGDSLRRVLRRERMQAARDLIEVQGFGSEDAAHAVGYSSRSHFARQFRSEIGRNPKRGADV